MPRRRRRSTPCASGSSTPTGRAPVKLQLDGSDVQLGAWGSL